MAFDASGAIIPPMWRDCSHCSDCSDWSECSNVMATPERPVPAAAAEPPGAPARPVPLQRSRTLSVDASDAGGAAQPPPLPRQLTFDPMEEGNRGWRIRQIETSLKGRLSSEEKQNLLSELQLLDPYSAFLCPRHRPHGPSALSYTADVTGSYSTFAPLCTNCNKGLAEQMEQATYKAMWDHIQKVEATGTLEALRRARMEIRNLESHTGIRSTVAIEYELDLLEKELADK